MSKNNSNPFSVFAISASPTCRTIIVYKCASASTPDPWHPVLLDCTHPDIVCLGIRLSIIAQKENKSIIQVNTASRMESSGEAMRIHLSDSTFNVLNEQSGWMMEKRGIVNVKVNTEIFLLIVFKLGIILGQRRYDHVLAEWQEVMMMNIFLTR